MPFEFTKNYKFTILNNENVWAKAMNRVVNEKVPVEKAVDEMIARIKEVARLGRRAAAARQRLPPRQSDAQSIGRRMSTRRDPPASRPGAPARQLSPWQTWGLLLVAALRAGVPRSSCSTRSATACGWRAIRQSYVELFDDPIFLRTVVNTLRLPGRRDQPQDAGGAGAVGLLRPRRAGGSSGCRCCSSCRGRCRRSRRSCRCASCSIPSGASSTALIFRLTGEDGPNWLNDPTLALSLRDADAHLEVAAVLDADPDRRAAGDPGRAVRGRLGRRRDALAEVPLHHLAVDAHALPDLARSCR